MPQSAKDRLLNLQALRAFAALLVVVVHSSDLLFLIPAYPFPTTGHGGVDLFFVVSGFVMVLTAGRTAGPVDFLWRRFARIAPLYWLVTLAVFTLAMFAPAIFKGTRADPVELAKSLLFIPYLKSSGLVAPVVFVGWTLNLEMAFYVLLTAAMVISPRNRKTAYVLTIAAVFCTSAIGWLRPEDPILRFYTTTMVAEFGLGMLLALGWQHLPEHGTKPMVGCALALLGVGMPLLVASPSMRDMPIRLIAAGLPSLMIVAGAAALDRWGYGWRNKYVQMLGDSSYSIYLSHFFMTSSAFLIAKKLGFSSAPVVSLLFSASVIAVLAIGVLLHTRVERPISRAISAIRGGRRAPHAQSSNSGAPSSAAAPLGQGR